VDGRRYRGSTGTANKPQAIVEERKQRERLAKSYCARCQSRGENTLGRLLMAANGSLHQER